MKKRLRLIWLVLILLTVMNLFTVESFADPASEDAVQTPTEPPAEPVPDYRYDPSVEGILTSYYCIDREKGFLTGVAPGTSAERLLNVCVPENAYLSQDKVATGTGICVPGDGEQEGSFLTVIVTGDLNGDGSVTITDMLMIKSAILGEQLPSAAGAAGDINFDGSVTITDFLRIKSVLLGMEKLRAGCPTEAQPEDPVLLLTPESSVKWTVGSEEVVNYVSGNEELIHIDGEGNVIALTGEGSAFVYALDGEGRLLSRAVVTVLQEKMEVYLDREECSMLPGAEQTLSASFNHPFIRKVTWTSSDPETVSVDENGHLTALKVGTAVITASIENGSSAQTSVTVIPPITSMQIERKLYKIKPEHTKSLKLITEPLDVEEEFIWESSDPSIAEVSFDGTVTGVSYGTVTITAKGKYSGLTASCQVKICDVKQVALTFDDGPSLYTDRLLDFLKENDIKVTFFLVANRIPSFKEETIREVQEGHEIGYHSYAHDMQTGLSSERITSDFIKSNAMLKELTGAEFTVWRTPGGDYNQRVLDAVELPHILWSLDTLDWQSLNAKAVCSKILGSRDGYIVLIHDLHRTSVEGAIMAMEQMIQGDYEFVTVTELLSRDGTPPENSVNYRSDIKG